MNNEYRCQPILTIYDAAGCPTNTATPFTTFVTKHPIWLGSLAMIAGTMVMLFGKSNLKIFSLFLIFSALVMSCSSLSIATN